MKKIGAMSILLLVGLLGATTVLHSEDYVVTLEVDPATVSDGKMLGLFMSESAGGEAVPRNIRGLAMQYAGEAETALSTQRVSEDGLVALDDGANVLPAEESALSALLNDPFGNGAEAYVGFGTFRTPSGQFHARACGITVCTPTGERILMQIPPVLVERGPGDTKATKCTFRKCVN